jgi:capsular polysaccharide biosynthesis protein
MILFQPALHYFGRLLFSRATLEQVAFKKWTIEPESTAVDPPAVFLESSLGRITGTERPGEMPAQMKRIRGGVVTHEPITAYAIRDATVCDGRIFKSRYYQVVVGNQPRMSRNMLRAERRDSGVLVATFDGSIYFGHWLTDDLPLEILGQEIGAAFSISRPLTKHQREYARTVGELAPTIQAAKFSELIVLRDHAQGKSKRERFEKIRSKILRDVPYERHRGVMICRGVTGQRRRLINEDEIATRLRSNGFRILHPESLSVAEIISQIAGASIVIGVEGSQLLHAHYCMAPTGSYLTLQPPNRFSNIIKGFADIFDRGYGLVVGHQVGEDFRIDIDEVFTVIEMLDRRRLA